MRSHSFRATLAAVAFALWLVSAAHAFTLYESGALGPTGSNSGNIANHDEFLGVRFQVTSNVTTTAIGGHFDDSPVDGKLYFGAIVALSDSNDFPDSPDLSTPDVLGHVLTTFPHPSDDLSIPFSLNLAPGYYGLVFGSGLFGANGETGRATQNNHNIGTPSWFFYTTVSNQGWSNVALDGTRFFVTAVPEPTTFSFITTLAACLISTARSSRRPIAKRHSG